MCLRLHLRPQLLRLRFRLAQLPTKRLPCRAQRRLSSASPPQTMASSRRLLSFAAAGAAGGLCGERGYGSDLVARSTALPDLVGVGPALLGVGAGAVRGGAGKLIAMTAGA
jgi:hypothetical protein